MKTVFFQLNIDTRIFHFLDMIIIEISNSKDGDIIPVFKSQVVL